MFYVFQMNTGDWWIATLGDRASSLIADDSLALWRAGLDKPYSTQAEAEATLTQFKLGR